MAEDIEIMQRIIAQNRIDQETFENQVKITKYQAPRSGAQTSTTTLDEDQPSNRRAPHR